MIMELRLNQTKPASKQVVSSRLGFTLVEVMVSIAIAGITVGVLFAGFSQGYSILRNTRDDLRATQILMQKTEAFRLFTWAQLANCPTTFTEYYNPSGLTNDSTGTIFYGTINPVGVATNIPDNSVTALYKTNVHLITITLNWTNAFSGKDLAHRRQMLTLNAIDGMQNYLFGQ